jgi:hypothetical protein
VAQRLLTIIAQDPSFRWNGKIVRSTVRIPFDELEQGPRGERVRVVDYDSSTRTLYRPMDIRGHEDPFRSASDDELLGNPQFHCLNVYAIIMRTLERFELGLGRRVNWSFPGHQLYVAPHAFAAANAFYSRENRALLFGYFPRLSGKGVVFTCLSHDIIAHETAHALLDGLRETYMTTLYPPQSAFHEAFADIVALLSVCSTPEALNTGALRDIADAEGVQARRLKLSSLNLARFRRSLVFGMGMELGSELSGVHGSALRHSLALRPSTQAIYRPGFEEPHRKGEILVAAVMNAFLAGWLDRLHYYMQPDGLDFGRFSEQGAFIATELLTMCIRALDYCPPAALTFSDFLSALLTAHFESDPADEYKMRIHLRQWFAAYGIRPTSEGEREPGVWQREPVDLIAYEDMNVGFIRRDPVEVFRFIWRNRHPLNLHADAHTQVLSVRTSLKPVPNGFPCEETAVEYLQTITMHARKLADIGVRKPLQMPDDLVVTLYGGGTLIFDERGLLRYAITNPVMDRARQTSQLAWLWESAGSQGPAGIRSGPLRAWPFEVKMPASLTRERLRNKGKR